MRTASNIGVSILDAANGVDVALICALNSALCTDLRILPVPGPRGGSLWTSKT